MVISQSNCNRRDDDNLPPSRRGIRSQGGVKKGRLSEQGVPSSSFNIDEKIRELEFDAYHALLRAFTAQSELLIWSNEGLMSSLRKELRIADEQHQQMLGTIGDNKTLGRILTWRCTTGNDPSIMPPHHHHHQNQESSPPSHVANFQSRKKQKISHASPVAPLLKPTPRRNIATSTSNGQRLRTRKTYSNKGVVDARKLNVVSIGAPRSNVGGRVGGGGTRGPTPRSHLKSVGPSADESWVGRSLQIRWSEDNLLYKALIVGYDKEVMLHRVAYDSGTPDETFEWLDLTKMSENDIQWLDNTFDPAGLLDGKGHHPLGFPAEHEVGKGGFKLPVRKSKGRDDEGRRPSDKSLQAPTPQSRLLGRGEAPAEVDNNGTNQKPVKYPEVDRFVKEIDALEHENDVEKLENGKRIMKEYEEMLEKALAMGTNFSIDGESKDDDDSSGDGESSEDDDDSSEDGDFGGDEGSKVSYDTTKLDYGEDNGDNDDYIEID